MLGILVGCAVLLLNHKPIVPPVVPALPTATLMPAYVPSPTIPAAPTLPPNPTATVAPIQPSPPVSTPGTQATVVPTSVLPGPTTVPPVPIATCRQTGTSVVSTTTFCLVMQSGWSVIDKDSTTLRLKDQVSTGNSGGLVIYAAPVDAPTTVQAVQQTLLSAAVKTYPDIKACGNPSQVTVDGITQTAEVYCLTSTPQSGSAFPAVAVFWAATNASGRIVYIVQVFAPLSIPQVTTNAAHLLQGLQWLIR